MSAKLMAGRPTLTGGAGPAGYHPYQVMHPVPKLATLSLWLNTTASSSGAAGLPTLEPDDISSVAVQARVTLRGVQLAHVSWPGTGLLSRVVGRGQLG